MINVNRQIIVTFRFAALHSWPSCDVPGKEYLRNDHRHVFHVTATKEVSHNDREIEIIDFKEKMVSFARTMWENELHPGLSCESIAEELGRQFDCTSVRVLEDGENGAILTFSHV